MSYALDIAPDAKSQWRELPVDIQELVLDNLDHLCDAPPTNAPEEFYYDFVTESDGIRNYVFLQILIDRSQQKLSVLGVNRFERPADLYF
jgi:hypothetical protein